MQMCSHHWSRLREVIEQRELGHLISKDAKTVVKRAEMTNEGYTVANFDPLMYAHNRIIENLINIAGIGLINNPGCPICEGNKAHNEVCIIPDCTFSYDDWIDNAADEAKETWKIIQNQSLEELL